MATRRIYSQLFVRYSVSVQVDVFQLSFCIFIQQQLWSDDFQIPPHRQAVADIRISNLLYSKWAEQAPVYWYAKFFRCPTDRLAAV
jgi:hypothetical protein